MKKYGGKKLTGLDPLAYLGVESSSPPDLIIETRAPTSNDYSDYNIGTLWMVRDVTTKIITQTWFLAGKAPVNVATWYQLYPGLGGEITVNGNVGTAISVGRVLSVVGDEILQTSGAGNTLTLALQHGTDGQVMISATAGNIAWANITAGVHGIQVANGANSITIESLLNFQCSGGGNVVPDAVGRVNLAGAGGAVITGAGNTITITAGGGGGTVSGLNDDAGNTAVPDLGGIIKILGGTNIDTVVDAMVDPNALTVNLHNVVVLPAGGSLTITDLGATPGVVQVDAAGLFFSNKGNDGEVLIGSTAGVPAWTTITGGNAIGVATGANSITVNSLVTFNCDALTTATPDPITGILQIFGAGGATVIGNGVNRITITGGGGGGTVTSVVGGSNINVDSTNPAAPIVNLDTSILQPFTNAIGDQGIYALGTTNYVTDRFLHAYGTSNVFLGRQAGNLTLTSNNSTIIGAASGINLANGHYNSSLGSGSLAVASASGFNVALGGRSLEGIQSGSYNIALGYLSGSGHTLADSSNIDIGNISAPGISNTITIGTQGIGSGQQNAAYIAGIYNTTNGATKNVVLVDSIGKLGGYTVLPINLGGTNATSQTTNLVMYFNGTSITGIPAGLAGQVLTLSGGGVPTWTTPTTGGTVTSVSATSPLAISGTPTINPNVYITPGVNGQLIIARTGLSPVWATLTASTGIAIANGSGSVTISSDPTALSYTCDSGSVVHPTAGGNINVIGGAAIKTVGSANTITINDTLTINARVASYVLALTDAGKFITMNNGAANTVTVPTNASVAFPTGTQIVVQQIGAGQTSIVAAVGVTIYSPGARLNCSQQYSTVALVKIASDIWSLMGDLS